MSVGFQSQTSHLCDDNGVIHVAHGHDSLGWLPLCVLRDNIWMLPRETHMLVPIAHTMLTCVRCVVGGKQRRHWGDDG